MPKLRKPRQIAPRLASGERRAATHIALPPHIRQAVLLVAAGRNQSTSWALEQLIIRASHFDVPEYVPRKKVNGVKKE